MLIQYDQKYPGYVRRVTPNVCCRKCSSITNILIKQVPKEDIEIGFYECPACNEERSLDEVFRTPGTDHIPY